MNPTSLTHQRLLALLHYDPLTGVFTWLVTRGKAKKGAPAGSARKDGYVCIVIDGLHHLAHRLAWLYVKGEWPAVKLDHKDTDPSHNWLENLRLDVLGQNEQNIRRPHRNNKSGVLGVHWYAPTKRWKAQIAIGGVNTHIGYFHTKAEAGAAYVIAKAKHHPFQTITELM